MQLENNKSFENEYNNSIKSDLLLSQVSYLRNKHHNLARAFYSLNNCFRYFLDTHDPDFDSFSINNDSFSDNRYNSASDIFQEGNNKGLSFEFPKQAYDRICKFYGNLSLSPISFVQFNKNSETTEFKKSESAFHTLESNEIGKILDSANCFLIFPKNYINIYDEATMSKIAPKMKSKAMKDIVKKAEIEWDILANYCEIQVVSTEKIETSKVTISYEIVENIFKYIPILQIGLLNGEKIDFTYYSYKTILDKCGINLENMIPYLKQFLILILIWKLMIEIQKKLLMINLKKLIKIIL